MFERHKYFNFVPSLFVNMYVSIQLIRFCFLFFYSGWKGVEEGKVGLIVGQAFNLKQNDKEIKIKSLSLNERERGGPTNQSWKNLFNQKLILMVANKFFVLTSSWYFYELK